MKVLGVDNVFLPVGDLDDAVAFYTSILGFPVTKRFDELGTVLFQVGDEMPGLGIAACGVTAGTGRAGNKVWFEVPDARAAAGGARSGRTTPVRRVRYPDRLGVRDH